MNRQFNSTGSYINFGTTGSSPPQFCPECGIKLRLYNKLGELWAECPKNWEHFYRIVGKALPRFDILTGQPLVKQDDPPVDGLVEKIPSFKFDHPKLGVGPEFKPEKIKIELLPSFGVQETGVKKREKPKPPETIWEWIKYKFWEIMDGKNS